MRYKWFHIKGHDQETYCDQCGTPLQTGDNALEGNLGVYCSDGCREDNESVHSGGYIDLLLGNDYLD